MAPLRSRLHRLSVPLLVLSLLACGDDLRVSDPASARGPVPAASHVGGSVAGDGELDPSLGKGGLVLTDFAGDLDGGAQALLELPDGKLVIGGGAAGDFALARDASDGTLDPSFGIGGKVTTDIAGDRDGTRALALQADGRIVAAGSAALPGAGDVGGRTDMALARHNPDGTLDAGFGVGGDADE